MPCVPSRAQATTPDEWLKICETLRLFFFNCTWFRAFINRSIIDLVDELGPVVVHINHIDVKVNRILHLVSIHIHCMSPELGMSTKKEQYQQLDRLQNERVFCKD